MQFGVKDTEKIILISLKIPKRTCVIRVKCVWGVGGGLGHLSFVFVPDHGYYVHYLFVFSEV